MDYKKRTAFHITKLRIFDKFLDGHNGYVAGGAFKNLFLNQKVRDVDIFFLNVPDFLEAWGHYRSNPDIFVPHYENNNVVAFKYTPNGTVVELIRKQYGSPVEIMDQFDFTVAKFSYGLSDKTNPDHSGVALFHEDYFEHLNLRKLVLPPPDQILYPVNTFERVIKYRGYGFGLCRESKQNLLIALRTADISDLSNVFYAGMD